MSPSRSALAEKPTQALLQEAAAATQTGDLTRLKALAEVLETRDDTPRLELLGSLFNTHFRARDFAGAESYARTLIEFMPDFAGGAISLSQALLAQDKPIEAHEALQAFATRKPDDAQIWNTLAQFYLQAKEPVASVQAAEKATRLAPDNPVFLESAIARKLRIGAWDGMEEMLSRLTRLAGQGVPFNPYSFFPVLMDPSIIQGMARTYAASLMKQAAALPGWRTPKTRTGKIRVGFFSNTLREHPDGFNMVDMMEVRDRERLEYIAYDYYKGEDTPFRQRLLRCFDRVEKIADLTDHQAVEKIRKDALDVLIDVDGYANRPRPVIMAARCAPVQATWLGYNGTMGAPFIDYIFTDELVTPEGLARFFDEECVYLPGGSFPNKPTRDTDDREWTRARAGLPEDGIVFMAMHQTAKILPMMLDAWASILDQVPDSVIWMRHEGQVPRDNLTRQFAARGIPAERIVFARQVDIEDHYARHRLADLFLDTYPYGAHTTLSDALVMGLPAVTVMGPSMASRIAGSMLKLMGAEDAVTASPQAYVTRAVELATDLSRRQRMVDTITASIRDTGVFDPVRYAREFESALIGMAERARSGQPLDTFTADPALVTR